jgi:hypothetical protein
MDATESAILSGYRTRIRAGENLNPGEVADFVALEARASAGNITPPHAYLHIHLLFNETNTMTSIIYLFDF